MSGALEIIHKVYKYFQRDEEIDELEAFYERNGLVVDAELRSEFVKNVPRTVNLITSEQESLVQQQIDSIDYKDDNGWEKLDKDSSVFVKLSKKHNKGESNSWGKATTTIDTSAENALAWLWDYCSNERLKAVKKLHKNPREIEMIFDPIPKKHKYRKRKIVLERCGDRRRRFRLVGEEAPSDERALAVHQPQVLKTADIDGWEGY
ncbi:hypothetical protein ScalyP_jg10730 [Parmales sp. scaly parma]|nr:hypothetical protein ScalyP_jg10730 [Parmales sp. scaly parma]